MTTIGKRVRWLRERKDWSQEDLARESELQRPHISLIENDERTPGAETLIKLAGALQTTTDFLLGLSDNFAVPVSPNHPALKDPQMLEVLDCWPHLEPIDKYHLVHQIKTYAYVRRRDRGEDVTKP